MCPSLRSSFRLNDLKPHRVGGGEVWVEGDTARLVLPPTPADRYADAQLDDYPHTLPRRFKLRPPQTLVVRARFSHPSGMLKGTAGFGFWNHPFTRAGDVIAPPRNVWFFYSSPESTLRVSEHAPRPGFRASVLNARLPIRENGRLARVLLRAANFALRSPLFARPAMALGRRSAFAHEHWLDLDLTQWHTFALEWRCDEALFFVEDQLVLRAASPPCEPLGFTMWIDNYRAAADSTYHFAFVEIVEEQWVEIVWL